MNPLRWCRVATQILRHRDNVRCFLEFCDNAGGAYAGAVAENELPFLQRLVEQANEVPGPIIEVGTLFGFTTQEIALSKSSDKELITIDNFCWNSIGLPPQAHRAFTERILHYLCECANVTLFAGSSADFYGAYRGTKPSMVFLDAGHTYDRAIVDVRWAVDQGVPIIAGHDYSDLWPGVKKAVHECVGEEHVEVMGSLCAYKSPGTHK